jgi:hypothetical protein
MTFRVVTVCVTVLGVFPFRPTAIQIAEAPCIEFSTRGLIATA